MTSDAPAARASKVPEITLLFWVLKIAATTLGETGGDAVTMSLGWGYLAGTALFAGLFAVCVAAQVTAGRFRPWLYWLTIVATTTVGTTLADFADRSLGIGYVGGSSLLFALLIATLVLWYRTMGSVSVDTVSTPAVELFYWTTILFSQTLGTALGDFLADTSGLGYAGGALVFGAALVAIALAWWLTEISRVFLFWARLHPDPAARCHGRRLPRQAARRRRPGARPLHGLGSAGGLHDCLPGRLHAASGSEGAWRHLNALIPELSPPRAYVKRHP
jgi:uncharacterized membrane-anchored protein